MYNKFITNLKSETAYLHRLPTRYTHSLSFCLSKIKRKKREKKKEAVIKLKLIDKAKKANTSKYYILEKDKSITLQAFANDFQ